MSDKIHLKVITHEKIVYENDVDELYIQTTDGSMGILKGHVPVIATLGIGITKVVNDKACECIATMGGILQFANNQATILTDVAELECDIDIARARHAKQRAEARMKAHEETLDIARAQMALAKAVARINTVEKKF
jgi:F-type H+-transporting ATPase subunit epsilon